MISIIGFLATASVITFSNVRKKTRDTRRLADIKTMQTALDLYYDTHNRFPNSDYAGCGGWDSSGNGTGFIHELINEKLIGKDITDPLTNGTCGNYLYYRYTDSDSAAYGCGDRGAFYVLGIVIWKPAVSPIRVRRVGNVQTGTGRENLIG